MKVKNIETDEEIEAFTPEEVQAQVAEVAKAKDEEIAKAHAEVERLTKISAEKTENFKKLNEMTEAERAALSAERLESLKRIEAAESKATAIEAKYNDDTQKRIDNDIASALAKYHGGDEKLKASLEENFKMINLVGTDTATIVERARLAAAMESGKSGRPNPLMAHMNGSAPKPLDKNKSEEFLKSEKGKAARRMMGETVE